MGKPTYLTATQLEELEYASVLRKEPHPWTFSGHDIECAITLPPHSVAAITFEFS
jgi:hypothetical protein